MSAPELIVNDDNIIQFAEKKLFNDMEKLFEGRTKESIALFVKLRKKITSMYMVTLLLYGKPIEITTIENLASDLHDQFFDVKDNLPNLPKIIHHAMDVAEHVRWKGFSEVSKDEIVKTFNDLIKVFKNEASNYIEANFENIEVSMFIENDVEFAYDDAVEAYAEENAIDENDIDEEKGEELKKKAYADAKIEMIKEFIFTII